jgi:putative DeoR family transcriptional regulator (stage III sporulation protein D)
MIFMIQSIETLLFDTSAHKDLSERLEQFNRPLYLQVKEVMEFNKAERHIRGGMATRLKYKGV